MYHLFFNCVAKRLNDYAENNHCCKGELADIGGVLKAVGREDRAFVDSFLSFGRDTHYRLRNWRDYQQMLKFGFTEIKFNKYDWIITDYFTERETIEFRTKQDNACCNRLEIGRGVGNTWTYGITYNTAAGEGSGWGVGIWCGIFHSKKEAVEQGMNYIISKMMEAQKRAGKDGHKHNMAYINAVLGSIGKYKIDNQASQLSLF